MNLIGLDNKLNIIVAPEFVYIKEFRELLDKDNSKNNERAAKELSFVYYLHDPASPFADIEDEEQKIKECISEAGLEESFVPSELLNRIANIYCKYLNDSKLDKLNMVRTLANSIIKSLEGVDFTKTNSRTGSLIYKPKEILGSIESIKKTIEEMDKLERDLREAKIESNRKIKGRKELGLFEDPEN